jgi:hypothetical protein
MGSTQLIQEQQPARKNAKRDPEVDVGGNGTEHAARIAIRVGQLGTSELSI